MIYVGIDIAKLNHFAAAISSDGEILIEPFKFSNDYDGFYLLLSHLAPLDQNSIIIGLESTAHYGDNLVRFLISKGFKVCVLNPIQTSFMRKNNVRKTKTDKVDTFVIAKTLMMQASFRPCLQLLETSCQRRSLQAGASGYRSFSFSKFSNHSGSTRLEHSSFHELHDSRNSYNSYYHNKWHYHYS